MEQSSREGKSSNLLVNKHKYPRAFQSSVLSCLYYYGANICWTVLCRRGCLTNRMSLFVQALEDEDHDGNESDSSVDSGSSSGPNFNYILNMPLWCLTKEKVEELLKQRDVKVQSKKTTTLSTVKAGLCSCLSMCLCDHRKPN